MRRYDIASRILIILSIIDFALAAPVLVQEKRQASPKDVTTVLRKRGDERLVELGEEYFKTLEKPVASSGTHSSSGPDPGATNAVQPPAPNAASSTANPDPLTESSSCSSSTSSNHGLQARGNCIMKVAESLGELEGHNAGAINNLGLPMPTTAHTGRLELPVLTGPRVPQADPYWEPAAPLTPIKPDFDWIVASQWGPKSQKMIGETSGHAPPPAFPQPGPESTDPESQSLSMDYQTKDLEAAALYAGKGKAKVPDSVRDVGNLA